MTRYCHIIQPKKLLCVQPVRQTIIIITLRLPPVILGPLQNSVSGSVDTQVLSRAVVTRRHAFLDLYVHCETLAWTL